MIWTDLPTSPATPIVLLLDEPEMSAGYAIELSTPAKVDKSLASKEERRVFARSFRLSVEYTLALETAAQCSALRHGLKRLKGEMLGVPLWMDQVLLSAAAAAGATTLVGDGTRPIRAGEWYVLTGGNPAGPYELVKVTGWSGASATLAGALQAAWPKESMLVPLMFGRFVERPEAEAITDADAQVPVAIREDSPYALRVNVLGTPSIPALGANVPGHTTAALWTLAPEATRQIDRTQADAIAEQLGYGRQTSRYDYSQPVRRGLEADFTCHSRAQIEAIELFFRDRRGTTRPFFTPSWQSDLELTANAASGASTLSTRVGVYADPDYDDHPGQPYLAVCDPLTDRVDPFKVATVAAGTVTLTGTTPRAYPLAEEWMVSHLLAVRFGAAALRWEYETDQDARTRLAFIEQTDEYLSPSSAEPEPVFLFRFTEKLRAPFAPTVWRFTSYEDVWAVSGDGSYTPGPFSFGAVKETTRLDRDELRIRSWLFPGNPLLRLWPLTLEGPLQVELFEADAATPAAAPELLFAGEIEGSEPDGPMTEATAVPWGRTLEQRLPTFRIQGPCNYTVYEPGCDKSRSAMRITGTVVSADLAGRRIIVGAGGAKPEGYFASGGYVEILLAGDKAETRAVLQSEPWASGTQTRLTLSYPLTTAVGSLPGKTAQIYPGCDGYPSTCGQVFENYDNYGGHFYVPRENPAIKAVPTKTGGGGKKG